MSGKSDKNKKSSASPSKKVDIKKNEVSSDKVDLAKKDVSDKSEVLIRVEDLCKSFGNNVVLDGINIEIRRGEVISVIGPSGCGKSTFIRSLNLLEVPTGGKIFFEGEDITERGTDRRLIREKIGMVFQQFNLFDNLTVKKNIMLAPVKLKLMTKEEANKKAMELLERVGLAEHADKYPSQLSGGQKQRVAIARSLAMNPKWALQEAYPRESYSLTGAISVRTALRRKYSPIRKMKDCVIFSGKFCDSVMAVLSLTKRTMILIFHL